MLSKEFFENNTLDVARNLIGKVLVRKYRGRAIEGVITETEAYMGHNDKASHASRGRTQRTEIMFGEAGHVYVYLIYGMYYCLNIVTEAKDYPSAVLIRGVVSSGINLNGPGKVARYFHIDKKINTLPLGKESGLWVENGKSAALIKINRGARVGVDYAGWWAKRNWRFYLKK
ncbi:DNA-3-methyladenine glycosylase [Candidatus Giovannonibacteria bacterium]|nr:DNA-3-methyladenine glycosylase [Candidatus Giovannonibacteria bacterium]